METLKKHLEKLSCVFLDTCCFIYLLEADHYPEQSRPVRLILESIQQNKLSGLTSPVTLTEIMTLPKRLGREDIAYSYKSFLVNFPNLTIPPIDISIADRAASIRGAFGFSTPDAIQMATATHYEADAFVTFDKEIGRASMLMPVINPDLLK